MEKILETWKEIIGYCRYQISNSGRVKSIERKVRYKNNRHEGFRIIKEKILKIRKNKYGYSSIRLYNENSKQKDFTIHRLVAQAFIPNPENKPCVNHIDGNKMNNHIDNLEWCTHTENSKHSYDKGLQSKKGEKHHMNKLTENDVIVIRSLLEKISLTKKEIAEIFNVSEYTIRDIQIRRSWKHI